MRIRKKKKQLPFVKIVEAKTEQTSYKKILWSCFVTVIFLMGNILSFLAVFHGIKIAKWMIVFSAFAGMIIALVTQYFSERISWIWIIRGFPVLLFIIFGPWTCWEGMRMWLNQIIMGFNELYKGGMVLFAGNATSQAMTSFAILSAVIFGEIVWIIIAKGQVILCMLYATFWCLVMLVGNQFDTIAAAFLFAGIFGCAMFRRKIPVRKSGLIDFAFIFFICMIGAGITSGQRLTAVKNARENMIHSIHEFRYGKDQLPEGKLKQAYKLQKSDQVMMKVSSEDRKNLYLKAYVGSYYDNGNWEKMPNSVYGNENAGLIRWLKEKNFDPLKQSAQYQKLSSTKKQSSNHVKIHIDHASRYYFYVPDSLEKVNEGESKEKVDSFVLSKGFFGQEDYRWTEMSSSRPAELTVAEEWVEKPKTAEQKKYSDAEAVYRKFVYDNYTTVDPAHIKMINDIFWKGYDSKSDGIYSALNQVRTKLRERCRYTKTPEKIPQNEDPVKWFLMSSHSGNQMLYASAAVEAFRAHGIPARYVEGYYVSASKMKNGTATITGQNAHAWVEVYFDGVGWKAIDVTPGYYYNVATLQKMVNTPEQIKKNAALKKNGYKGKQTSDSGNQKKNIGKHVKKTVQNITMILLGIVTLLFIVGVIIFVLLEIKYLILERVRTKQYEHSDMDGRIKMLHNEILGILFVLGMETKLGWNTKEIDKELSQQIETISKGDYERVASLLEKTIYGEITLELYEERTIRIFREKLIEVVQKCGFLEKFKMRYRYFKYCDKKIGS